MAPASPADFYSRWSRLYDGLATRFPGIEAVRREAAETLVAPGECVLEVGCGTGANLPHLREQVGPEGTVVGIDLAPGALERARERVRRNGWENVHLVLGDGARLPVDGVDAILGSFVAGMFADPARVVAEWRERAERVGLLCAAPSEREAVWAPPLNAAFGLFVRLANPGRLRHSPSPAAELGGKVKAARGALGEDTTERSFFGGLLTFSMS